MSDTLTDRLRHFSRHTPSPYMRELASRAADSIAELEAALREARHERDGETRGQDPVVAEVSMRLNAGAMGRCDTETETLIPTTGCDVAHSLRAEGFDVSEDGTGRGTPLVPVAYQTSGNCGAWETGNITGALDTNTDPNSHVVCFSAKDYGADAIEECNPTLRAGGHTGSHANEGVMPAIVHDWRVRRLTPTECERLQAFPDGWTKIEWRGKPADQCPDGPRYKALGNSMAVNVMSWIGERIAAVDAAAQLSLL